MPLALEFRCICEIDNFLKLITLAAVVPSLDYSFFIFSFVKSLCSTGPRVCNLIYSVVHFVCLLMEQTV